MLAECICQVSAKRYRICASVLVVAVGMCGGGVSLYAQGPPFDSGSHGEDGPLSFTTPSPQPIFFDPTKYGKHIAGDTIFKFSTITIAKGVTVRLDSTNLPGPVYWLASGDVNIAGTLDLSGQQGYSVTGTIAERVFSIPGAGGFAGGPGGGTQVQAEPGAGPGGGAPGTGGPSANGKPGKFSGSTYLIPLIGGSGGGGAFCGSDNPQKYSVGGGAGGGAVLIASSTSITVTGAINAFGGNDTAALCAYGGAGSGGAIRLMANSINFPQGSLNVSQGNGPVPGSTGLIRLEATTLTLGGYITGPYLTSIPASVALPTTGPSAAKVVSVAGVPVNGNPFTFPSFQINTSNAVPVVIQGQNIPLGAIPTLTILSETGPDQVITAPALTGTFATSTSTVNVTYPGGGSRGLVKVTWKD